MNDSTIEIAPSILSADFSRLGEEIEAVERGGATILHVDVMDGHFVPNLTVGFPVVKSVARATKLPIDAHVEADAHLHRTLAKIKSAGARAGVVINPATPIESLNEALPFADYVLVMSVDPGFGGQRFISTSVDKVRRLRLLIEARNLQTRIEIDGGIDLENIASVVAAGAEIIVAGSAIFGSANPEAAVRGLRDATVQWV